MSRIARTLLILAAVAVGVLLLGVLFALGSSEADEIWSRRVPH